MMRLILGSQSPRRKEILSYFTLPFEQHTSHFDEESIPFSGDPAAYVAAISEGKALELAKRFKTTAILTADTTVYCQNKIYGKPSSEEEAFRFISELSGQWHSVFTAVTLVYMEKKWTAIEETRILFNALTPEEIRHYHATLHWADKAGGYAIQMAGGLAVRKIEGCYYNVMGLPINSVRKLLLEIGVDLWKYLK